MSAEFPTVFVAAVGWCDEWQVVGASTDKAKAESFCDAAMEKPLFYGEQAKPEYRWVFEQIPFAQ